MARFELVDIDYDQRGFGEMHAVPELQAQLPRAARVARQIPGPDRPDYYAAVFDRPVKYHPSPTFDWTRAQPEFISTDEIGRYLWVPAIIIASLMVGSSPHAGMKGFSVNVAYVVDNTAGRDDQLDFAKCDPIGWGSINDLADPPPVPDPAQSS